MISEFEKIQEERRRRRSLESAELNAEAKEKKEDEEAKKMAARERVEVVSREVKNTKQQIQNIIANMQQVVAAVAAIRVQLKLQDAAIPSVAADEKSLVKLQKKLTSLTSEIEDLRKALLLEERRAVAEDHEDWTAEAIVEEAEKRVVEVLKKLGL
ncbi:MAG: hypothetical protein A2754_02535 [Candidatus Magasanikbacteria bacterium RIFCSPHIGHO2_01_FULL_47_8]|uniref:Uncharacterized protein n=1 Tax=Candidatus Magasanikbacteria bacterium RIFCSPHIGHO2_01_FULL_47_8 TaxID=1798673 RepID=A0A1F6MBZ5_9BACT|nr:MAG: hypothetical protein A2754_02535 [Candidatus Magasanikbacteria bacterium RIFCSPHIGHO2_01_FULL_47_8]